METNASGKQLSVFAVWRVIKRRKFHLLIPLFLLTAAAGFYALRQQERFRARTLVGAETATPGFSLTGRPDAAATANVQEQLRVIRETLFSEPVLETVIREFNLYDLDRDDGLKQAMEQMKSRIQIQVEAPDAFYVGFEGTNRQEVMHVANRLAELFIERTSDLKGQHVEQVDHFLDAEVDRLRRQLAGQEEGLKAYKQSVATLLPERLAGNLKLLESAQQQIQSKTDQITEGQARRSAVIEELKTLEKQGVLEPEPRAKTTAETNLEELRLKLRQLKARYTPEHPEITRAEKEIQDLEAAGIPAAPVNTRHQPSPAQVRYFTLQSELKSLDLRLKDYLQERETLTAQMSGYERRVDSSPGYETTIGQRMRDVDVTRTRYEALYQKQQEAKLDHRAEKTSKSAAFKIVEPAQLPPPPAIPQRSRLIIFGLLAGLGVGVAAVLLAEQMDTSFGTIEEFQGYTNLPVLSTVPAIPAPTVWSRSGKIQKSEEDGITPEERRHYQKRRLAILSDPQSVPSEQYGILTLKVQQWMEQTGSRVLVVTSAAGGEGKSVTALNLSLALASSVQGRVALVDADLRRPRVHEYLGLKSTKGLSDLLIHSNGAIDTCITRIRNLDVIPGGAPPANPVGLLASLRSREMIARLRDEYRLIVLDSPPIVPTADSHILAGLADGVLIVVRARQTRRELLRRAIESLGGTNVLGVVLNDVEYGDTRYAYAYRYYQRHYLG